MPFSKEFIINAAKLIEVKSVDSDFAIAKDYIMKAIKKIAKDIPYSKESDIDIYIHGSYANVTNIFFPSNLEICVELKIPQHEYTLSNNYFVAHNMPFAPRDFRAALRDALSEIIDPNCTENDKCIIIPQFGKLRHTVEITPCFSFEYTEPEGARFKGVLLYDAAVGADIITFPKVHAKNGQTKDVKCEGNFKRMVRLFKSLNAVYARENETSATRGYFIECLLFNVPDALFRGSSLDEIFIKILNYLLHANLDGYVCQNLIWQLFGSAREFWDINGAHKFIRQIKVLYKTFPSTRTMLA